jgi:myo-inositol 2-dehydrogenase / D-chiro-inositol 1-dehydrogenase
MNPTSNLTGQPNVTRRVFLKNTSLAVAAAAVTEFPFVSTVQAASDDPIHVALIGCGGRGTGAAQNVLEAGQVLNAANSAVKLVAFGDIFPKPLETIRARFPEVPAEHCFSGFDAYQKVLALPEVNYVILATPPGFRPMHLRAALEAGKNVFMEKPVAVDGPGIRSVLGSGELAARKGLHIAAGTQRRHQAGYLETIPRLQDGVIGEIICLRAYWNGGAIWHRGYDPNQSEMENQIYNWYHYVWLSGDHICEQHVHNLDVCNWIMNAHPVSAYGQGGRQAIGNKTGHIWDHFAVEFEYPGGVRMFSQCRQINHTDGRVSEAVHGAKGTANPAGTYRVNGGESWKTSLKLDSLNPYVQEHIDLIRAIRGGKPLNEARNVAESTLTAILGRESAYSGLLLSWDEVLESKTSLMPEKLEWGPAPHWEVAIPGIHKLV